MTATEPEHDFELPPLHRRLLAWSFTAGPALLVLSAASFALGIGTIPPGITSWVEGIFGAYALALFVPIYLELSRRLGRTHPRFAAATAITGLLGATCGFAHELARPFEHALRLHGAGDAVWAAFYADPTWPYLVVALLGPLFPLTSVALGAGFLRARTLPRWVAVSLVVAGVGFPLAQVVGWEWGLKVTYPLATVLWLVALSWIGRSMRPAVVEVRSPAGSGSLQAARPA